MASPSSRTGRGALRRRRPVGPRAARDGRRSSVLDVWHRRRRRPGRPSLAPHPLCRHRRRARAVLVVRLSGTADRARAVAAFSVVPAASALAWFAFFWIIWGTPNPAAPYGRDTQSALAHLSAGPARAARRPAVRPAAKRARLRRGSRRDARPGAMASPPRPGDRGGRRPVCAGGGVLSHVVGAASARPRGSSSPSCRALALPLAVLWARGGPARRAVILLLLAVSASLVAARVARRPGGAALQRA